MKNVKSIFRELESSLRKASWFSEGWEIYNRGVYLQLSKEGWYNERQNGVHFETYIEKPQIRERIVPIFLHAETDVPKQREFIEHLLSSERERIRSWRGYEIVGYGYSVCRSVLPLNVKHLSARLFSEMNRLRQLESAIDDTIAELSS